MSVAIHPTAVVSPTAVLGDDVVIGPFCVVEDNAHLGDNCVLESHAVVKSNAILGKSNHLFEGAVLGGLPQHVSMPERTGLLIVGDNNTIRENVTIHRGLNDDSSTVIGNNNLLMVGSHVAHDCQLGDRVIMANGANLGGFVSLGDRAYVSATVAIHQFCRVGCLAMIGGHARIVKDVPPYVTIDGQTSYVVGLNLVGLRRSGFKTAEISQLKAAYRLIYRSGLSWVQTVSELELQFPEGAASAFHTFFCGGTRGFTPERRLPRKATIKMVTSDEKPALQTRSKAG